MKIRRWRRLRKRICHRNGRGRCIRVGGVLTREHRVHLDSDTGLSAGVSQPVRLRLSRPAPAVPNDAKHLRSERQCIDPTRQTFGRGVATGRERYARCFGRKADLLLACILDPSRPAKKKCLMC